MFLDIFLKNFYCYFVFIQNYYSRNIFHSKERLEFLTFQSFPFKKKKNEIVEETEEKINFSKHFCKIKS